MIILFPGAENVETTSLPVRMPSDYYKGLSRRYQERLFKWTQFISSSLTEQKPIISTPYARFLASAMVMSSRVQKNASIFLKNMIDYLPFKFQAIQSDQGSEFRGEFETTCKDVGLTLCNLPRKSPNLNAHVERLKRTWREDLNNCWEFSSLTLEMIKRNIESYTDHYNSERFHKSLDLLTPLAYLKKYWPSLLASGS